MRPKLFFQFYLVTDIYFISFIPQANGKAAVPEPVVAAPEPVKPAKKSKKVKVLLKDVDALIINHSPVAFLLLAIYEN